MKIRAEKGYVLVVSPALMRLLAVSTAGSRAKGAAVFPFIIVKDEEFAVPWLINHERIHFRQQIELLFIGAFVFHLAELLYNRLVLKMPGFEAYLWSSSEQEAYRNQYDFEYLKKRKAFSQFWYLTHKQKISLEGFGKIVYQDETQP